MGGGWVAVEAAYGGYNSAWALAPEPPETRTLNANQSTGLTLVSTSLVSVSLSVCVREVPRAAVATEPVDHRLCIRILHVI